MIKRSLREYFYTLDIHGQLFLSETTPKNLTSCFKDTKFLDFFFHRLRMNTTDKYIQQGYHYVSPCGVEMNYLYCEDAPIVFHELKDKKLIYAGTKSIEWNPTHLSVSLETGRLYHSLPDILYMPPPWSFQKSVENQPLSENQTVDNHRSKHKYNLGLIKSSLVQSTFASRLSFLSVGQESSIEWDGKVYPLKVF